MRAALPMSSTAGRSPEDQGGHQCRATSHAKVTGTTPSSTRASTRSPVVSDGGGIPPVPTSSRRALACDLAARHRRGGGHERASLTVAVYLTQRWLPSKKMTLRTSTWDAYRRIVDLHLVPRSGGFRCGSFAPITSSACTPTCSTTDGPTARRTQQQDRRGDPHDPAPSARRQSRSLGVSAPEDARGVVGVELEVPRASRSATAGAPLCTPASRSGTVSRSGPKSAAARVACTPGSSWPDGQRPSRRRIVVSRLWQLGSAGLDLAADAGDIGLRKRHIPEPVDWASTHLPTRGPMAPSGPTGAPATDAESLADLGL